MTDAPSPLTRMTLREKASLFVGATPWTTTALPHLDLRAIRVTDGPHGVRLVEDAGGPGQDTLPATCFPTAVGLASSWNTELLHEVGAALGEEAASLGADVLLGPGVNMKRTPLCGRNFEYFSEDPFLAGELAVHYIDGLQSRGVGASLKHFALNNQEFQRNAIDVVVDERPLREIYLAAFEAAVTRARPWTVMAAYNRVDGELCYRNARLLKEILVDEWGFDGVVVSDWGAVRDPVAALEAGLHLEMPGPKRLHVDAVVDAVEGGRLDPARLDEAVARILGLADRAASARRGEPYDEASHHALAQRAAAEGMVLLQNGGALPLDADQRIAIIGRSAREPHLQGGGSAHVRPTRVESPWDALSANVRDLRYAEGWAADLADRPDLVYEARAAAADADVAVVFAALPGALESEGYDRRTLALPDAQIRLLREVAAAGRPTVVVLNTGGAIDVTPWADDVDAIVQAWTMGQAGGGALADLLLGRVNPSGKLAETFPLRLEDTPAYLSYPGENGRAPYAEGLFIGYRYYDARELPVAFPFGHGLSYTTFAYRDLQVSPSELDDASFDEGATLTVRFDVTNTGEREGQEVAQLYVHDREARLRRPVKELKGFAKVRLRPGETHTVTLTLDRRAFAYYDPAHGRWVTESGAFDLLVGASAADIRLRTEVTLRRGTPLPFILDHDSTLREWLDDPRARSVLGPLVDEIRSRVARSMHGDDDQVIGMDLTGFLMDMPLVNVLAFHEEEIGVSAAEQVDALLARAREAADGEVAT
ncbi:MAG: glycoside hydrolase family 3 C-terminal domain-containing protein [Deinococcales bacterium]